MCKKITGTMQQMRRELMSVYREVAQDCETQKEAFERTVNHPASRYFVDAEWAYQMIYPMLEGDMTHLEKLSEIRREMYISLMERTVEMSRTRNFCGKSAHYIIQFAVTQKAPKFFIGTEMMRKIFRNEKRKRYAEIIG